MADIYLTIAEQSDEVVAAIAASMNARGADPDMAAMCRAYMGALPSSPKSMLEIGCGNGASTEFIAEVLKPLKYTGIDPSPGLLALARDRFASRPEYRFAQADAVHTGVADASQDLVVAHTIYSHLPDPDAALAEACRVLRPGGTLAIFDGDYATNTVALFDGDPLQSMMQAAFRHLIHAPYVMRTLSGRMLAAGLRDPVMRPHGYIKTGEATYLYTLMSRAVDKSASDDEIGQPLADALKDEVTRRVAAGAFYGSILFASITAHKPG